MVFKVDPDSFWLDDPIKKSGGREYHKHLLYNGTYYKVGDNVILAASNDSGEEDKDTFEPDEVPPHVAKIVEMFEEDGEKYLRHKWYYRPRDIPDSDDLFPGHREIFASKYEDNNSVSTILSKGWVLTKALFDKAPKNVKSVYYVRKEYEAEDSSLRDLYGSDLYMYALHDHQDLLDISRKQQIDQRTPRVEKIGSEVQEKVVKVLEQSQVSEQDRNHLPDMINQYIYQLIKGLGAKMSRDSSLTLADYDSVVQSMLKK